MKCHCHNWRIKTGKQKQTLRLVPSPSTVLARLKVTAVAVMLLAGIVLWMGFPPSGKPPGPLKESIAKREAELEQLQKDYAGAKIRGQLDLEKAEAISQQMRSSRLLLEQDQRELATASGPPGFFVQSLYWTTLVTLALIAVGYPCLCLWEQVLITVHPRGQMMEADVRRLGPSSNMLIPPRELRQLVVIVEQKLWPAMPGSKDRAVRGWLWRVCLLGGAGGKETILDLQVDFEDSLPLQLQKLTARVRGVTQFLEAATRLPVTGPIIAEVVTTSGSKRETRVRQVDSKVHQLAGR